MAIELFSIDKDEVINGDFITGKTNYQFAISKLLPLIDRLDIQRKGQNPKFYSRLEEDILKGCIMPPLTLAFVGLKFSKASIEQVEKAVNKHIDEAFILDGLQRMRTLQRAAARKDITLDLKRPVFTNIILCDSMDKLLYRMITLNNGQKPMTARHQIEIVASNVYNFSSTSVPIQTEKNKSKKNIPGAFKQADFIKAYLAFLSRSINIDNTKIIEEKMDELIADKILETNIKDQTVEFSNVIDLIGKLSEKVYIKKWFQNVNNLIGFASSIGYSYKSIDRASTEKFQAQIQTYENAFQYFDVSKIRVGDVRRKTVHYFIRNFDDVKKLSESSLIDRLSQEV